MDRNTHDSGTYMAGCGVALPPAFVERVRGESSVDGCALLAALGGSPAVGVRLNADKPGALPEWMDAAEPVPWCDGGFWLASRPEFTLAPALHQGGLYVQDPSSMVLRHIVGECTADRRPVTMLDLCAAPGGKSTAALAALPAGSVMVSNEVMPPRAAVLAENVTKWGNPGSVVTSAQAERFGALGATFDIMVLDAPCSGEGMMRKDSKAVAQWSPGLVESCARLQRQIADAALPALRSGGTLIYSTCTFSRQENEEMVHYLMNTYGMESIDLGLERFGVAAGWSDRAHTYRFMPHVTRGEGLFVAALRLPEAVSAASQPRGGKRVPGRKGGKSAVSASTLPQWLAGQSAYTALPSGGGVRLVPNEATRLVSQLTDSGVRLLAAGVEFGTQKGRDFVPGHGLAMSTALRQDAFPDVPLEYGEALDYLRRENIPLPPGTPRGYVTVSHGGRRLGFMKSLGNRANNLYPQAWRIRNL